MRFQGLFSPFRWCCPESPLRGGGAACRRFWRAVRGVSGCLPGLQLGNYEFSGSCQRVMNTLFLAFP